MDSRQRQDPVFELRGLTKFYGKARGVEDVSLAVERGEIFGLLGPNGAGKTTILRTVMGCLRPSSGRALLFGTPVEVHSATHHERLGYLPADFRLWPRLTAGRVSDLFLRLGPPTSTARRDRLAADLELPLDRKFKHLSLGNRQKVGLLLALQHAPDLLFLDEPTSGLDPLVRRRVMDMLREFVGDGGTIIYSSHHLEEVEKICSRVGILRGGRLVALKTIEEIRAEREKRLELVFRAGGREPDVLPENLAGFRATVLAPHTWEVRFRGSPDPLLRWLADFDLVDLDPAQVSLEEAFLGYYREESAGD